MLVEINPIDWKQIVLDLRIAGVDSVQVSKMIGVHKGTIQNMIRGHEPRYSLGEAILKIHKKHCGS